MRDKPSTLFLILIPDELSLEHVGTADFRNCWRAYVGLELLNGLYLAHRIIGDSRPVFPLRQLETVDPNDPGHTKTVEDRARDLCQFLTKAWFLNSKPHTPILVVGNTLLLHTTATLLTAQTLTWEEGYVKIDVPLALAQKLWQPNHVPVDPAEFARQDFIASHVQLEEQAGRR